MGNSERDIIKSLPYATVLKGLAIKGSNAASSRPVIEKWITSIEGED